jgi:hypothetical protein
MYPDDVAGMVLIDPTQEQTAAWVRESGLERRAPEECNANSEVSCASDILAQAHESAVPANIPVVLIHAIATAPVPFRSKTIDEMFSTLEMREPVRLKFHKEWVDEIPGGQLITTNTSHGLMNFEAPELVVRTIRETVEKARKQKGGGQ